MLSQLTRSLRGRLALSFTSVAAGSLLVAITYTAVETRRALEGQIGADRAQLADQLARYLGSTTLELMQSLEIIAQEGELLAASLGMADPASVEPVLEEAREPLGVVLRLSLYGGDAGLVASAGEGAAAETSVAATEWYRAALGEGKPWFGPVYLDADRHATRLAALPVRTSNGQALGVLLASVDWQDLMRETFAGLEDAFREEGAPVAAFLVDPDGTVLGATDPGAILQEDRVAGPGFVEALAGRGHGYARGDLLGVDDALVGYAAAGELAQLSGRTPVVLLAQDGRSALASARRLLILLTITALIISGAVAVLAWWLAARIARPLVDATRVAELLAVGDTEQNVQPGRGDDEAARLQSALHGLLGYMRALTGAAEQVSRGETDLDLEPKGEKDALSRAFLTVGGVTRDLLDELGSLTQAAAAGDLSARARPERFAGGYRRVAEGLNQTLDAVVAPVNEAADVLDRLAARDLTARVSGQYQGDHARIKGALNGALDALASTLTQVAAAAEEVSRAAHQIEGGSQSLAETTNQQASSLEEVSSSLQEMSSMARQNAANAKEARSLSSSARTSAETGLERMKHLSGAMDRIKGSSDETAKIVKTIDEIAFQTNLLALNAAVEAARAGDAGKSFAVVAEEVRNLAMRSAEAAKDTAALIEEAVSNAASGFKLNQEVLASLSEIQERVLRTGEVVAEIAAASEQQNQGVDEISEAVEELNRGTQSAAATAQQSASSAEELSGQSATLRELVDAFQLTDQVRAASPRVESAAPAPRAGSGKAKRTPAKPRTREKTTRPATPLPAGAAAPGRNGSSRAPFAADVDPESIIPFGDDLSQLEEF
jgi:methyl-accepting chemotaxis protein